MASTSGNRKIAKVRSAAWKRKLVEGRQDSLLNPSIMKKLRLAKGQPQEKFADALNVSMTTFAAIERGRRAALPATATKIAQLYKKKVGDLFDAWSEDSSKYIAKF
jgi:DNA-binding XRE family transcriptional regulator